MIPIPPRAYRKQPSHDPMRIAPETTLLHFTLKTHCQQPHGSTSSSKIYSKHFMTVRCVSKNYNVDIMSFSVGLCGLHQNIIRHEKNGRWKYKSHLSHAGVAVFLSTQLQFFLPKVRETHDMGVCLLPKIATSRHMSVSLFRN